MCIGNRAEHFIALSASDAPAYVFPLNILLLGRAFARPANALYACAPVAFPFPRATHTPRANIFIHVHSVFFCMYVCACVCEPRNHLQKTILRMTSIPFFFFGWSVLALVQYRRCKRMRVLCVAMAKGKIQFCIINHAEYARTRTPSSSRAGRPACAARPQADVLGSALLCG